MIFRPSVLSNPDSTPTAAPNLRRIGQGVGLRRCLPPGSSLRVVINSLCVPSLPSTLPSVPNGDTDSRRAQDSAPARLKVANPAHRITKDLQKSHQSHSKKKAPQ